LPQALLVIGLCSIMIGGILALSRDDMKRVLAYSTIGQYGYVVVLLGLGGVYGAVGAAMYVLAHAAAKCALFLTAGAVTEATGTKNLSEVGGLGRPMPLLAVTSGIAAAAIAALPGTMGFFKDELFFAAAITAGPVVQALAVAAAALTFAYIGRFWLGLFVGPPQIAPERVAALLVGPVALLGAVAVVGGIVVEPFAHVARDAAAVTSGGPVEVAPAYHLDGREENLMALAAWALGALVLLLSRVRAPFVRALARAGDVAGPRRWYALSLSGLNQLSNRLHDAEVRDLRNSLAAVLVPGGLLVAAGFLATPTGGAYAVGGVAATDLPIIALLALALVAAVATARDSGRLRPVLGVSVVGFALGATYALAGAPDVALVAVVVETVFTLVFVGVFSRLPSRLAASRPAHHGRNLVAGVVAGVGAFATIWGALSRPAVTDADAAEHLRRAPAAHGGDVVTVILADFRGLDTMVEITVLAVAVIGVGALLRNGRGW
jgi:multicomponent Na+:H+ antiporter subunit A